MSKDKFKCGCLKEECQKELVECKDWEVNKKKKLEEALSNNRSPYCLNPDGWEKEEGKTICTRMVSKILPPTAFCQECQKQIGNEYGDIMSHLETDCQKQQSNLNNNNKDQERERERERESILAFFKQNNIKSITLQDNNLIIVYQDGKTETNQTQNQELSQIKSYLQTQATKTITQQELKEQQDTPPKKNYLPYILGGIGLVSLVGVIVYFLIRKNKDTNSERIW